MSIHTFYRLSVWLPIALPLAVAVTVNNWNFVPATALDRLLQIILMSLVGLVAYAPLALWGTVWIGKRREDEIRRRAMWAPVWMIPAVLLFSLALWMLSDNRALGAAVFMLSVVMSLGLGYLYVAIVFGLRRVFYGPYGRTA
jgi:hypothetical protein